jgi:hypothetical protein
MIEEKREAAYQITQAGVQMIAVGQCQPAGAAAGAFRWCSPVPAPPRRASAQVVLAALALDVLLPCRMVAVPGALALWLLRTPGSITLAGAGGRIVIGCGGMTGRQTAKPGAQLVSRPGCPRIVRQLVSGPVTTVHATPLPIACASSSAAAMSGWLHSPTP